MGPAPTARRSRTVDVAGLALVAALCLWTALVAGDGDGRPAPVLWLLGGLVLAVAIGRAAASRGVPLFGLVAVAVAGAAALSWPGLLAPAGAPTGYANTNAALLGLGALSAMGASRAAGAGGASRGWSALAVVLIGTVPATGSVAGTILVLGACVTLALAFRTRWPALVIGAGMVVAALSLGLTVAIGSGSDPVGLEARAGVRGELWAAAEELADEQPVIGIGPGRFAVRNPVTDDDDLRWAHHGYLQVAAELGVVGLVLTLGILAWAWAVLWRASHRADVTPVSAAALGAVATHATVDYVLHIPAVLVTTAVLVGFGSWAGSIDDGVE